MLVLVLFFHTFLIEFLSFLAHVLLHSFERCELFFSSVVFITLLIRSTLATLKRPSIISTMTLNSIQISLETLFLIKHTRFRTDSDFMWSVRPANVNWELGECCTEHLYERENISSRLVLRCERSRNIETSERQRIDSKQRRVKKMKSVCKIGKLSRKFAKWGKWY